MKKKAKKKAKAVHKDKKQDVALMKGMMNKCCAKV